MRKTTLAIGAAVALTVMAGGAALAQQAAERGARGDTNGDGRISRSEFVDGRIARLTAVDANRDGSVSVEERQSGIDTRRNQRASARFETLDKDGSGALSREEFTSERVGRADRDGRQRMGGHRGRPGGMGGHRGGRGNEGARANGPISIAEVQTRMTTRFDGMDTDNDGFVTAAERQTARQAMRSQWQARRAERMARRGTAQPSPSAPASE